MLYDSIIDVEDSGGNICGRIVIHLVGEKKRRKIMAIKLITKQGKLNLSGSNYFKLLQHGIIFSRAINLFALNHFHIFQFFSIPYISELIIN